uniref:FHA domain-containing protein n=1 Tax=Timema monikensis TaxID=170555 RepID=A0A7R9E6G8_9NEOP|nr:unnamed protein product [Timema monikensis]
MLISSSSEHIVVSSQRPAAGLVVTVDRQDYIPSSQGRPRRSPLNYFVWVTAFDFHLRKNETQSVNLTSQARLANDDVVFDLCACAHRRGVGRKSGLPGRESTVALTVPALAVSGPRNVAAANTVMSLVVTDRDTVMSPMVTDRDTTVCVVVTDRDTVMSPMVVGKSLRWGARCWGVWPLYSTEVSKWKKGIHSLYSVGVISHTLLYLMMVLTKLIIEMDNTEDLVYSLSAFLIGFIVFGKLTTLLGKISDISMSEKMKQLLSPSLYWHYLMISITLCFVGFQAIQLSPTSGQFMSTVLFLLCLVSQLGLLCWSADKITVESYKITEVAFGCQWYNASPAFKFCIQNIIRRSQKPVTITAGMFGPLSLKMFMSMGSKVRQRKPKRKHNSPEPDSEDSSSDQEQSETTLSSLSLSEEEPEEEMPRKRHRSGPVRDEPDPRPHRRHHKHRHTKDHRKCSRRKEEVRVKQESLDLGYEWVAPEGRGRDREVPVADTRPGRHYHASNGEQRRFKEDHPEEPVQREDRLYERKHHDERQDKLRQREERPERRRQEEHLDERRQEERPNKPRRLEGRSAEYKQEGKLDERKQEELRRVREEHSNERQQRSRDHSNERQRPRDHSNERQQRPRDRQGYQRDQEKGRRRDGEASKNNRPIKIEPSDDDFEWGKKRSDGPKDESKPSSQDKQKPDFGLSGKLAEDTNTFNGVVVKYSEPPEARKPKKRWRLYPFKGEKCLQLLHIHRQSAFLFGKDRRVADIPIDHPSCSKQHAALQYRLLPFARDDGSTGRRVRPYIIDLESSNGTFINNVKIEPRKYVELIERDVVKFGYSSREYVLLHEQSKDEGLDEDVQDGPNPE